MLGFSGSVVFGENGVSDLVKHNKVKLPSKNKNGFKRVAFITRTFLIQSNIMHIWIPCYGYPIDIRYLCVKF